MKRYLGYLLVTPKMGSKGYGGYGGYDNFIVCEGDNASEVIKDYFIKLKDQTVKNALNSINGSIDENLQDIITTITGELDEYNPKYVVIEPDGTFYYHDYFTTYFIELPGENVYMPSLLNIIRYDKQIKFRVGDHVYFTKTEQELRYHGGCFRAEKTSIPIARKIVSITMTEDTVQYQISGCGIHFENKDIGKFVFSTYKDAKDTIDAERGVNNATVIN